MDNTARWWNKGVVLAWKSKRLPEPDYQDIGGDYFWSDSTIYQWGKGTPNEGNLDAIIETMFETVRRVNTQ